MSSRQKTRHQGKDIILTNVVTSAFAIAPSDNTDLQEVTLNLYVSVAGAVKVTLQDGSTVTYPNLIAGRHPLRVSRVFATGTTATGLVGEA